MDMASVERGLSHDSTIYSYQLVKKISHSHIVAMLFALLFMLALIGNVLQDRAVPYIVCFPAVLVLQAIVCTIFLKIAHPAHCGEWRFQFGVYWMGLVPKNHSILSLVIQVQTHILNGGLLIIGVMYPWLDPIDCLNLLFAHLWVLTPRFGVMYALCAYKRIGMIKISRRDTSCYLP
jgi:hypothetical protein